MFSFDTALPVQCIPYPNESGYGYCLRAIHRNGANLHALRRMMNLPEMQEFHKSHALALASIFGISPEWLSAALGEDRPRKFGPHDFWGHTIYMPRNLRWATPQVCPICIHRHGYCKAIWDVALSTVCLEHGCYLIDSCKQCGQALRWNRPSVDVGHCKHYIQAHSKPEAVSDLALNVQRFLEHMFNVNFPEAEEAPTTKILAPDVLRTSNFGAALIYMTAFGANAQPTDKGHALVTKRQLTSCQWREIALRGWERFQSFDLSGERKFNEPDLVLSKLILKILAEGANPDDAPLAIGVLRALHGEALSTDLTRNSPLLRQQVLFK